MRTRSPFLTGLFHPLNLVMLVLSVIAGLISAWWLFPLGLFFWAIMVLAVARDPSLRISHQMQSRDPLAQRFQQYFDRIERAQVGVFNSLSSAPANTQRVLQPIRAEIDTLTRQVYGLCQRMTVLENYRIVSQSRADLENDLQQIGAKIAATQDLTVRQQYEDSRRSLEDRLAKLKAVSSQLDGVEAQLMGTANDLDAIVTEVVRLQAMGAKSAAGHVPGVVAKLRQETAQIKEFERNAIRV